MGAALSTLCAAQSERLTGHWLGLGRFDHILVTLAKEAEPLLQPERAVQCCHHASSHWSCFGRVILSSFDLEAGVWPADQGVVVGVCGIKLAHALRDKVPDLKQVADALTEQLKDLPGQWLVSSTTGWEDMVLIYWTDDFQTLSRMIGSVRRLRLDQIKPHVSIDGVHAILTTCTLAGIHLPPDSFEPTESSPFNHERWVTLVSKRLAPGPLLDWAVRFELRPGHFDPFYDELKSYVQRLPPDRFVDLSYRNVMGQYDFRVQHQGGSQQDWLCFMGHVALPLSAKDGSLVRSMETHLHIDVPEFSEGQAAAEVKRVPLQNAARNDLIQIVQACEKSGIAPHTQEVFRATHNRLMALQGDDLQNGTFTSVENLFIRLGEGLSSEPDGIPELDRKLAPWLYWVERCLADRYRGTYPLGETVVPRLGTYQASHHGFLASMDCIGQDAFDYALSSMNCLAGQGVEVPSMAVCCFIGSSPSPNALSFPQFMRCGFIELPAIMIFKLRELPVLLHEVGHLFVNAVTDHHKLVHRLPRDQSEHVQEKVKIEIQEILAEMFACCACYNGDVRSYGENRTLILESYLPDQNNRFTTSSYLISMARLIAVHWLIHDELSKYKRHRDAWQAFRTVAVTAIREELRDNPPPMDVAKLQGEAEMAAENMAFAMQAFAEIRRRQPAHEVMIQAIKSLCDTNTAPQNRQTQTLEFMKQFTSAQESALATDFQFIEEMVSRAVA
jgi:hypothetical protein